MSAKTRDRAPVSGLTSLPRVNLLPPEIHQRRRLRQVQTQLGGAFVAAILVVIALFLLAQSSMSSAEDDLAAAQVQQAALQEQVKAQANVGATYAAVDTANGLLRDAGGNEVLWSTYLADIGPRLPAGAWLTTIKVSASPPAAAGTGVAATSTGIAQISFDGVALSHVDVARWLDSLAKERTWINANFARSEEKLIDGRKTYNFTSTVTVTGAALSGRYTKPAGG